MLIAYDIVKINLFLKKVPIIGVIWNKKISLETNRCSFFEKNMAATLKMIFGCRGRIYIGHLSLH